MRKRYAYHISYATTDRDAASVVYTDIRRPIKTFSQIEAIEVENAADDNALGANVTGLNLLRESRFPGSRPAARPSTRHCFNPKF